jgi:flagellar capping protein FliD
MNINDFVRSNLAAQYLGKGVSAQAAFRVDAPVQSALGRADKRIQSQVDTTTTQLSSMGKLKSAVAGIQTASTNLENLGKDTTVASEKASVSSFVSAFNDAIKTAKTTAETPGEVLAANSAIRAGKDLQQSVGSDAKTLESLKKLGITQNTDGTLSLDSKKFDAAQKADAAGTRETLTSIGKDVKSAAGRELANSGNVGLSMSYLSQRTNVLKAQQSMLGQYGQDSKVVPNTGSNPTFNFGSYT